MKKIISLLLFIPIITPAFTQSHTPVKLTPQKILFGSCSHQDKAMPIFNAINQENADLFIPVTIQNAGFSGN